MAIEIQTHRKFRNKLALALLGCAVVFALLYFFSDVRVRVTFQEGTDAQRMQSAAQLIEGQAYGIPAQGVTNVPTTIEIRVTRWKWLFQGGETKLRSIGEIQSIVVQ